jgi:CubicO group peptidase (beta-lactamase class C family)
MDSARLQQMMEVIDQQGFAYDSVLVVRHGTLVFEEYRNDYDQDSEHHLQSATKSVSSMLIGIAIHEGFLEGVEERVVDLLPGYDIEDLDARKQRLTLEHLLTMSDGIDWHERDYPYSDPRNSLGQMWASRDALEHILDQPMAREPGEAWAYNSGTSMLLGGILQQATGQDVLDFARQYLFDPLGIDVERWDRTVSGHYHTDGGLYMTPRDMARFGYLMLLGGTWDGKEIVSPEWVYRSTAAHYQAIGGYGYGYQWWTQEWGIFAARGHYEQLIYVVPEADMVVVFTGQIPDEVIPPTDGLLFRYILAACTDLPPEAMRHTYADHGFTFEYPAGLTVQEAPLPGHDGVTAEAGDVQFSILSWPLEIIQVVWFQAGPDLDLETSLAGFLQIASQQPETELNLGEAATFAQGHHSAIQQPFEIEQSGLPMKGVVIAWHCAESQRVYFFSYVSNPEVSDRDLAARLQEHLDSFNCHPAD